MRRSPAPAALLGLASPRLAVSDEVGDGDGLDDPFSLHLTGGDDIGAPEVDDDSASDEVGDGDDLEAEARADSASDEVGDGDDLEADAEADSASDEVGDGDEHDAEAVAAADHDGHDETGDGERGDGATVDTGGGAADDTSGTGRLRGSVGRGGANQAGDVAVVQQRLADVGLSPGAVDRQCGPATIAAIEAAQRAIGFARPDGLIEPGKRTARSLFGLDGLKGVVNVSMADGDAASSTPPTAQPRTTAPASSSPSRPAPTTPAPRRTSTTLDIKTGKVDRYGAGTVARLRQLQQSEPSFYPALVQMCRRLRTKPEWMINVMMMESGIDARRKNPSSTATGLIQFMAATARGMGTTTAALRGLSNTAQLVWVEKYFKRFTGQLSSQAAVYAAVGGGRVGQSDSTVFYRAGSKAYKANKIWDVNKDGQITQGEFGQVAARFGAGTQFQLGSTGAVTSEDAPTSGPRTSGRVASRTPPSATKTAPQRPNAKGMYTVGGYPSSQAAGTSKAQYTGTLTTASIPGLPINGGVKLAPAMIPALQAIGRYGGQRGMYVTSGVRTDAEQAQIIVRKAGGLIGGDLWKSYQRCRARGQVVAWVGSSPHRPGKAFDIGGAANGISVEARRAAVRRAANAAPGAGIGTLVPESANNCLHVNINA
ncbi:MAG: hypothetical protein R3B06_15180 [Kofleriaceae bacterium]